MSRIPESSVGSSISQSISSTNDALRGLDLDQFLKLFIAELQNQDPLNPLDNSEILQQISQIREVGATNQLTETLESVLLGQNLASATSLIGRRVSALDERGLEVSGIVDRVTISDGKPKLHIGDETVDLTRIREIVSDDDVELDD